MLPPQFEDWITDGVVAVVAASKPSDSDAVASTGSAKKLLRQVARVVMSTVARTIGPVLKSSKPNGSRLVRT